MSYKKFLGILLAISPSTASGLELENYELVDLSHSYGENTLYWPTSPTAFEKEQLAYGISEGGWFYSAYSVCTPEHGGTHIDAPMHFSAGGNSTEKIPLESLLAPAVVIDVSKKAAVDRNYRLTSEDVEAFENKHGEIAAGTIVLMRTDWSNHWPDAMAYLGDDTPRRCQQTPVSRIRCRGDEDSHRRTQGRNAGGRHGIRRLRQVTGLLSFTESVPRRASLISRT